MASADTPPRAVCVNCQFVDDISARYFHGVHIFIPIISRPRFHDQLVNFGAPPPTSFSLLLLCMCLITYHPEFTSQDPESLDITTLYITTKALFAQVQASNPPSLHIIQAGTIIAAYEYANKKIAESFATISTCIRMGYASRLHLAAPIPNMDHNSYQQAEEEGNTWWGLVACERTIFCELAPSNQPLASRVPARESRLPTEPMLAIPNTMPNALSPTESASNASGFGCIAQATWLLDELFKTIEMSDADDRLNRLDGLDHTLRTVLAVIMDQSGGAWGTFCTANGMIIRGLFILHSEIINQVSRMTTCKRKSPDEWMKSSYLALDSFTKMVRDIAVAPNELPFSEIDTLPPSCAFVIQATLLHINDTGGNWNGVREELEMAKERFNHRWAGGK
ncbi:hypothetical protein N7478_011205 [Penicillium angulare]|uniref:uncharacterized protein n=1 Tax=Penicillium angulare TaxID=116970 RepID=UPI0025423B3F|nr:uncharacterized protein N7478_011205 [Penicillium angulare]KAJ5263600.1 hypothetical protein N7478_011205 [Penicillium angulare]